VCFHPNFPYLTKVRKSGLPSSLVGMQRGVLACGAGCFVLLGSILTLIPLLFLKQPVAYFLDLIYQHCNRKKWLNGI